MSLKDYRIEKELGKGAFGSVSKVTKLSDGKTYAMKTVKIGKLSQPEKESALNEIRILYSLENPNIIYYYEAFYDEPTRTLNIIMEFADDGDLAGKIKQISTKREHFTEDTIWNCIIQMLEGMKYLHNNNILHRDLKCANIFLTKKGVLKIGDLNVSKVSQSGLARTQTGTPYYCSPEIWKDCQYDHKCDVWSIGCIIYELCALVPPFRGTSLRDLAKNVLTGKYPPIPRIYSKDLSDLISKMLTVDTHKRYSTDQLLNCDIVQKRIKSIKNSIIPMIIKNNEKNMDNVNMIKTIKLPRNMKDINKALPKRRKRKNEGEMMMNDEFETKKAMDFKKVSEQLNNENKYIYKNDNLNNKYVNNNDNLNNKYAYKNDNLNNKYVNNNDNLNNKYVYNNDNNNYKVNNNIYNNNNNNNNLYGYNNNNKNSDKYNNYQQKPIQNPNNQNKNLDYYQQKGNNQNILNNYDRNQNKNNAPIRIKAPPQKYNQNPDADKYLREAREEQKRREQIQQQNYQKNQINYNNLNNNNKPYRPQSGNKQNVNRYQNFYGNESNQINNPPKQRPQSGRPSNQHQNYQQKQNQPHYHYHQQNRYNNQVNAKPSNKPGVKPPNSKDILPKRKVIYERMNYQDYKARYENKNNRYGGNQMNVNNKNNLYKAMGVGGNNLRRAPKVVNHKP